MQRAVRRRESLPPAACGAIARLLERFLEEELPMMGLWTRCGRRSLY
jgi:hypothetical protein